MLKLPARAMGKVTTGLIACLFAALLLSIASPANAGLGGDYSSVTVDQAKMLASLRMLPAGQYSVHELQMPSGTIVREYVSTAGKVFAVTWHGPLMPELQQLFGSYFTAYKNATQAISGRHGPLAVSQSGLVVRSNGHMRAFSGQAYVPQLMPSGMLPDQLK